MKKLMVMAAGLLVAGAASAQGAFIEGTVGFGKADLGDTSGFSVDNKDTNLGFTAGYMFNKYIGVEAGYRDLGSVSATASGTVTGTYYGSPFSATGTLNASADANGWLLGVRGNLPINEKFSLNARLGWFNWDADAKATASGTLTYGGTVYAGNVTATGSDSGTDIYYGLGANYNVTKQVGVGVGYTKFKLDDVKVDSWDINVNYRF
ncbi:MAG: outer membrane beta-barrel protein [Rhodocyclaceae bacterium]|nr:outer membrane beta-barrel protein [Rhodocyclaceae bacterium]